MGKTYGSVPDVETSEQGNLPSGLVDVRPSWLLIWIESVENMNDLSLEAKHMLQNLELSFRAEISKWKAALGWYRFWLVIETGIVRPKLQSWNDTVRVWRRVALSTREFVNILVRIYAPFVECGEFAKRPQNQNLRPRLTQIRETLYMQSR